MPRDDRTPPRDPEGKRNAAASPRGSRGTAGAGAKRGRSGYGMESIRPHLRDQLEASRLMRPTFPPEGDEDGSGGGPGKG